MASHFIHSTAVVDEGAVIGEGSKIWHFCHVMPGVTIGQHCNLGQNVFVATGVAMGNNVKVQNNVSVYEGVELEDDVFLGPSMVFTNIKNPRSAVVRKGQYDKTLVKQGASIGANATIVCGIVIGSYALIGAGSVVTKNVKPYALLVGNPAKQIGWVSEYGHRLEFNEEQQAVCQESGQLYELENGTVKRIS